MISIVINQHEHVEELCYVSCKAIGLNYYSTKIKKSLINLGRNVKLVGRHVTRTRAVVPRTRIATMSSHYCMKHGDHNVTRQYCARG